MLFRSGHKQKHTQQDVCQCGAPESKEVQGSVAVRPLRLGQSLVVVGGVDGVDPHIAWERS